MEKCTDISMCVRMDGGMDGWMDKWCKDRWEVDGWMEGWTRRS